MARERPGRIRGRRTDRDLLRTNRSAKKCDWYVAARCPNVRSTGEHNGACVNCQEGYLYQKQPKPITVLITSDQRSKRAGEPGMWEKGSATGTIPAHIDCGDRDRIIPQNQETRYEKMALRGDTDTDSLEIPHVVRTFLVVDKDNKEYKEDINFDLVTLANGYAGLKWRANTAQPATGQHYTVLLIMRPIWVISSVPKDRGFGDGPSRQLPWRCDLKRFDQALEKKV